MPLALNHLVTLPWTFFSLGRHDWLLKAGKVYLHWSHSSDLRLSAISFEFNNIYLDGFHMIDVKLFHTLQILKLFLLFIWRTNRTVIFSITATARSSSQNAIFFFLFFCSEEVASYFKQELPSLANSGDQCCLRSPPTPPVRWCTGQWHQYFQLILGCACMLNEEVLQHRPVPFPDLFPSLSASPACTSGRRWMLNFAET